MEWKLQFYKWASIVLAIIMLIGLFIGQVDVFLFSLIFLFLFLVLFIKKWLWLRKPISEREHIRAERKRHRQNREDARQRSRQIREDARQRRLGQLDAENELGIRYEEPVEYDNPLDAKHSVFRREFKRR